MLSLPRHLLGGCVVLLAACSKTAADAPRGDPIECALDGATEFAAVCTSQTVEGGIVLHRPDGGFRRLSIGGGRIEASDGADPVRVSEMPGSTSVEIAIGDDRYRTALPAATDAPAP